MSDRDGPVLIDLSEPEIAKSAPSPAEAPPVPDLEVGDPTGSAMVAAATWAARPPSRLARWFWSLLVAIIGAFASVAAWNFLAAVMSSAPILGYAMGALIALFIVVALMIAIREVSVFARLKRIDTLHHAAEAAISDDDLEASRKVVNDLARLYRGRDDTQWGLDRFNETKDEQFDADALIGLAEQTVLAPLDATARKEVEAAARQVATVTALVPLALADVVAALTANIRMIRRIAEIYGGRSGTLGSWRLTRAVMAHLVATGAVAIGDDMLEPILGGGILGKLSRRFGEGLVNGALTARVGAAAMEVCRPLPFHRNPRPSASSMVKTALTGLFKKP